MRIKFIVLTIFIAAFLGILLFKFFYASGEDITKICDGMKFPELTNVCYAYESKDLKACEDFEGKYSELCSKAVLSRINVNESLCNGISNENVKSICLRKLAFVNKDPSLCRDDYCYLYYSTAESCDKIQVDYLKYICLAKVTKDLSNCNFIEDEHEMKTCKSISSNQLSDCEDSSGSLIPYCVVVVSENTGDWKYCSSLSTEYQKAECTALASSSIDKCNNLNEGENDFCKIIFLGKDLGTFYE